MTIPTPTDTRQTRRADQLKPGDWIIETGEVEPIEILDVFPWETGDKVLCVYRSPRGLALSFPAEVRDEFWIASPADRAAMAERRRRSAVAAGLREFADIASRDLPLPPDGQPVDVTVELDTPDAVKDAARILGATLDDGEFSLRAAWRPGGPVQAIVYCPHDTYRREVDDPAVPVPVPGGVAGEHLGNRDES